MSKRRVTILLLLAAVGALLFSLSLEGFAILNTEAGQGFTAGDLKVAGYTNISNMAEEVSAALDPPYAASEISIVPYPVVAGVPTQVCVEITNPTPSAVEVQVQFAWANFGIGIPFTPINGIRPVQLPPNSTVKECLHWIPPVSGQVCLQVVLDLEGYEPIIAQRNLDVNEPLRPGVTHPLSFPVGNPLAQGTNINLNLVPHITGWGLELSPDTLLDVAPGETRQVTLSVTPPTGVPLPEDGKVIVDVEAYAGDQLIGGFRKVFRPPVPLHVSPDPPYAEREISIYPYPARMGIPAEVCVELRNPGAVPQEVVVQFAWANFGIGIPFTPIDGAVPVYLPPNSVVVECIHWIPPVSGHVCLEVTLEMEGYLPQKSQRNLEVDEPLQPGVEDKLTFQVGNPSAKTSDINLQIAPLIPGWYFELDPQLLESVAPGEIREVDLYVAPPQGIPLPADGTTVVDVEAYIGEDLIGGFRKVFRPPVPLHTAPDPPYAEREISVSPYPVKVGYPVEVCVELRNQTSNSQDVDVQFAWANFGIGIPFTPIDGTRPVHLPPHSLVTECIHWVPPVNGHLCLQVTISMEGYQDQKSQRNLDVDEPLQPGIQDQMTYPVGNPLDHVVDIELGLVPRLPGWEIELQPDVLLDVLPGETRNVTLMVRPPGGTLILPFGTAIVDVEAYAEGNLIGGLRKTFHFLISEIYLPLTLVSTE